MHELASTILPLFDRNPISTLHLSILRKLLLSTHDFPQFYAVLKFANVNYMIISVFTTSTLHRDGFSFGSELWKRNDPQVAKMKRQKSAAECEAYTVLYGPSHVNPRL